MSDLSKVTVRQGRWRPETWVSWLREPQGSGGAEMVQSLASLMSVCV